MPKANILSITANDQSVDKNSFQDNTTTGFTFPSRANDYSINVNFLYPTTVDRMGILQGKNGTNVDLFDTVLNQSPEYPRKSGRVGELVVSNPSNTQSSAGVTFVITRTTDGQPPRNVVLYIEGCNQVYPSTKAQVESGGTTARSGLLIKEEFLILNDKTTISSCIMSCHKYITTRKYA